jgi:hypothetical protein
MADAACTTIMLLTRLLWWQASHTLLCLHSFLCTQGDGNEGFFDEYDRGKEEEEEEEPEVSPRERRGKYMVGRSEVQMLKPGPFDDLFGGPEDGDMLSSSNKRSGRKGKAAVVTDQQRGGIHGQEFIDKTARNKAKRQRKNAKGKGGEVAVSRD